MFVNPNQARQLDAGQLAGFNPLKAIGRALGAPGRALVAAIPIVGQGTQAVLDSAARQPAKVDGTLATAAALTSATPTTPVAQAAPSSDMIAQLVTALASKNNAPAPPIYSPSQYAPPSNEFPAWLIPAALGGLALVLVLGKK